jgi:hypothetical protein
LGSVFGFGVYRQRIPFLSGPRACVGPYSSQIYKDKMAADAVDDAINNRRQNMQEYVADWFLNRHGIKSIADNMVAKFKKGLKAYRSSNGYCDTFGRFWGVFAPGDTWSEQQLDMYLMILGHCMSAKGDPIHVIFDVANKVWHPREVFPVQKGFQGWCFFQLSRLSSALFLP